MAAKKAAAKKTTAKAGPKLKFGSPAWNAKYGVKKFGKKGKK